MAKKLARKAKKKKTTTAKKRKMTLKKKVQTDLSAGDKAAKSAKAGYVFRDVYAAPPSALANVNALRNFGSL
jgi:hypothetical protein